MGHQVKSYSAKKLLVTGGAGFIGANFVRDMLKQNHDASIVTLDKLTYAGSLANLKDLPNPNRHHFIQGDICDAKLIQHILNHHQIDTIVHFAAESHVDRSIQGPAEFMHTNILGTFTLLDAAKKLWLDIEKRGSNQCRFHHISTDEVYGSLNLKDRAFTETTPYQPRSPYAASKASSDHIVHAYHHTYGLPITLSNCSNNYGPYQHQEKLIPTIIHHALSGKDIPIYGNGKNIRDWLYVTDHVEAIMQIIEKGKIGESYNIGGNNEWENIRLAHHICEQLDKIKPQKQSYAMQIKSVSDRQGHDFRYAIDNTKIQTELNWQPKESFETGIQKTIIFYMK